MSLNHSPAALSSSSSSSASSLSNVDRLEIPHQQSSHTPRQPNARTESSQGPRRRHRRKKNRRSHTTSAANLELGGGGSSVNPGFASQSNGSGFYFQQNLSGVSMDSTALLDHREQVSMRPRRSSTAPSTAIFDPPRAPRRPYQHPPQPLQHHQPHHQHQQRTTRDEDVNEHRSESEDGGGTGPLISNDHANERTSLLGGATKTPRPNTSGSGARRPPFLDTLRGLTPATPRIPLPTSGMYGSVNFPPSMPSSPRIDPRPLLDGFQADYSGLRSSDRDTIIHIGPDAADDNSYPSSSSHSSHHDHALRAPTHRAEEDVCFPVDDRLMDEDEEASTMHDGHYRSGRPRRRGWPDMSVLEEWTREEKEERSEGIRAKKLPEPVYVGGRLRPPVRPQWHRDDDDLPYRFTYFNDELPATIHSHTISELLQPGQSFSDLFRPEPRVLEDSSDDEPEPPLPFPHSSRAGSNGTDGRADITPPEPSQSLPRLGPRPTFWLDVFKPTDAEMKVISKAFGIHPLTTEDIMMQEAREKVELFRSYYLVSYRTFEQDNNSEDYMDPVNIYVVVFRDGVISFHFSMTPHPANVRRRIRQLKDYITVSADWISYALIDDITDAFQPLIQSLEEEVDNIDDAILRMHLDPDSPAAIKEKQGSSSDDGEEQKSDGEMLKRVGDSRRDVMSLYRLMGNKADVIKGFAKRCNEQWQVAPRSEIGLYLGDIQDHIVTMVSNLNHMEKILSRSHSNYLAQINIKMNERQEQTADVLGRLTVLGTIVLPMNIITGLWGMNVMVPGQAIENLDWFWCITAGLMVFAFLCYTIAKRVYKIM